MDPPNPISSTSSGGRSTRGVQEGGLRTLSSRPALRCAYIWGLGRSRPQSPAQETPPTCRIFLALFCKSGPAGSLRGVGRTMYRYLKDVVAEALPVASTNSASPSSTPQQTPQDTPTTEAVSVGGVDQLRPSASVRSLPQPPESSVWCAPFLCRFEESFNVMLQARTKVPLTDTAPYGHFEIPWFRRTR